MDNEDLVTINLEELTNFITQLESINVEFDDEVLQTNLEEINENLKLLNEYLIPTDEELLLLEEEDLFVEEIEVETAEVLEDEPDLYLENLKSINEYLEIIATNTEPVEVDEEIQRLDLLSKSSILVILVMLTIFGVFYFVRYVFNMLTKHF